MNKNKGFTLIELLVVIAIIGILSSVVLASLNSARNKGSDAATKNNLANIRAQAEMEYDSNNNYNTVCGFNSATPNPTILAARNSAASSSGGSVVCAVPSSGTAASAWAISAPLKSESGHWCVDSTGASKKIASALTANATVCP